MLRFLQLKSFGNQLRLVVILVVLTEREFRFSLLISQLLAKAIPVRGANVYLSCLFPCFIRCISYQTLNI
ncbi:hypothetical protein ACWQEN_000121 [Morganella morganii]